MKRLMTPSHAGANCKCVSFAALEPRAGAKFVSFPWYVYHFLHAASREKCKHDSNMRKYHSMQSSAPNQANRLPSQGFFWSDEQRLLMKSMAAGTAAV
jgi:hypothetical protein